MRGKTAPLTASGFTSGTVLRETLANGPTTGGAGHTLPTRTGLGFLAPGCFLNINMLLFGPIANPIRFNFSINFWTPALAGLRFPHPVGGRRRRRLQDQQPPRHSFPYARLGTNVWPGRVVYQTSVGSSPPRTGFIQLGGLVTGFRL